LVLLCLAAVLEILQSKVEFALLEVDNSSFFDADLSHIGVASTGECFDGLVEMSKFLLAHTLADVREPFAFVEIDGFCEIFERVVIVILL
jgi:hypothetical protein